MIDTELKYSDLFESAAVWLQANPERSYRLAKTAYLGYIPGEEDISLDKLANMMGVVSGAVSPKFAAAAKYYFSKAVELNPNEPQYKTNLAYGCLLNYDPYAAELIANNVLEEHPEFQDACVKLF